MTERWLTEPSEQPQPREPLGVQAIMWPIVLLGVMWLIFLADAILPGSFTWLGVRAWDFGALWHFFTAPLLHLSLGHILGNSVPFLVLGLLVAAGGTKRFWLVTAIVAAVGGIGPFFLERPGSLTVGASVLVFGYFGYLVARPFFERTLARRVIFAAVAVVVALLYGTSMLIGVLPTNLFVSWQGHLFGAIGGVAAAYLIPRFSRPDEVETPRPF